MIKQLGKGTCNVNDFFYKSEGQRIEKLMKYLEM